MSPLVRRAAFCLTLVLLTPCVLRAQWIDLTADVTVSSFSWQSPSVSSYARAVLYGPTGARDYSLVILGHEVWEETSWWPLYQGRIASDLGLANNFVTGLPAMHEACYYARASGHSNRWGIHEILDMGWYTQCVPTPPERDIDPSDCPVLLDLEGDGFHLSGADPAVRFDIDADGVADSIAWTKAGEDEAFLCLDRNHNGVIDDGSELFGWATPLRSGRRAVIGYRALAELDLAELGGNQDGRIDARDSLFSELCAWVDEDRNGISEAHEIHTLDEVRVEGLDYQYKRTGIRDEFGNAFRYVSRGYMYTASGRVRSWPTFDVIFAAP